MIVAPDRETPGIMARHCTSPINAEVRKGTPDTPAPVAGGRAQRSIANIATPPIINVQHTNTALPSIISITSPKASPRTTAGKNATARLRTKWIAPRSSPNNPLATSQNVRQYSTTMARIAAGWIAMLNTSHSDWSKPSSSVARIKCPVEDTGRYSVIPSTMPRMMATQMSVMRRLPVQSVHACDRCRASHPPPHPAASARCRKPRGRLYRLPHYRSRAS